jgi:hypothetical protein
MNVPKTSVPRKIIDSISAYLAIRCDPILKSAKKILDREFKPCYNTV